MQVKSKSGRMFHLPSDKEDTAIRAGIAADPDTHEVTNEEFKQLRSSGQGWQAHINALLRDAVTSGKV